MRGFFFVFLLIGCNRQENVNETGRSAPPVDQKSSTSFTYTSPAALIEAMKTIAGYEDSHNVPGHEKLGHDHTWIESWTNNDAMAVLGDEGENYRKLNPAFEGVFSSCLIPDYEFHTLDATTKLFHHYPNSTKVEASQKQAVDALKKVPGGGYALIFKNRIMVFAIQDASLVVIPRETRSSL